MSAFRDGLFESKSMFVARGTSSINAFKSVVDIDLIGTLNIFRGCRDLLVKSGGSLIAIPAGQAVNAMPEQVAACTAKGGDQPACARAGAGMGPGRPHQRHFAGVEFAKGGMGR